MNIKSKFNLSLHSLYYSEACNEIAGPVSASLRTGKTAFFKEMSKKFLAFFLSIVFLQIFNRFLLTFKKWTCWFSFLSVERRCRFLSSLLCDCLKLEKIYALLCIDAIFYFGISNCQVPPVPMEELLSGAIGVNFLLSKFRGGKMFLRSLVKLNNSISVGNFAPKFR